MMERVVIDWDNVERKTWKDALVETLRRQNYTHVLTLSWNRDVPLDVARSDLAKLHCRIDRNRLGPRYNKKPRNERLRAVFVFEAIDHHIHCHSLWCVRQGDMIKFARHFPGKRGGTWNNLVPSGSYELSIMSDWNTVIRYFLKGQHAESDAREIVWSDDLF